MPNFSVYLAENMYAFVSVLHCPAHSPGSYYHCYNLQAVRCAAGNFYLQLHHLFTITQFKVQNISSSQKASSCLFSVSLHTILISITVNYLCLLLKYIINGVVPCVILHLLISIFVRFILAIVRISIKIVLSQLTFEVSKAEKVQVPMRSNPLDTSIALMK